MAMKKEFSEDEIREIVNESTNVILGKILNEGYSALEAKRDLNIVGAYIWGHGNGDTNSEIPSRREAVNAYMNFTRRFWKKLEILS